MGKKKRSNSDPSGEAGPSPQNAKHRRGLSTGDGEPESLSDPAYSPKQDGNFKSNDSNNSGKKAWLSPLTGVQGEYTFEVAPPCPSLRQQQQDEPYTGGVANKVCRDVLDAIGDTPLIQLNKIPKSFGVKCRVLAKCEFFNAGGSVKDRIGRQMVEDAEREGRIIPGVTTLIEPTSGNTGIGIALAAAVKGYRCIIVLPEKMSKEKVDVLKALGAEIVRTPTEAAHDAPDSHISVARRLNSEIPNSHILDQYTNISNPLAHYSGTAEELIRQVSGLKSKQDKKSDEKEGSYSNEERNTVSPITSKTIDMLVAGTGTGGTMTGVAKRLKEFNPNIEIVGVDPKGSILACPDNLNDECRLEPYHVEGTGYDFIPNVLDRSLVDTWIKTSDKESLIMMRRLIREEGLLCGGSCGGAVVGAMEAAKKLREDQTCVVILPDGVRNYMTKALSDDWMVNHNFVDHDLIVPRDFKGNWWAHRRVKDLQLNTPLTITSEVTCKDAIALLKQEGFDMVPVIGNDGAVMGVVTEGNMTSMILSGRAKPDTSVMEAKVIYRTFRQFNMNDPLEDVARSLDHEPYALVVTRQRCFTGRSTSSSRQSKGSEMKVASYRSVVSGIISRIDLLDFISTGGDYSHHQPMPGHVAPHSISITPGGSGSENDSLMENKSTAL